MPRLDGPDRGKWKAEGWGQTQIPMARTRKIKEKRRSKQAQKILALEQKNKQLEREARKLRKQVRSAVRYHKKVKVLRSKLAKANKSLRAERVKFRAAKVAYQHKFKKIKLAKAIEQETAEFPSFKLRKRRKRRRKAKPRQIERRPQEPKLLEVPGTHGEMVRIISPVSYEDWSRKLKSFRQSKAYKMIIRDYPRITFSVYGNPYNPRSGSQTFKSLDQMLEYFDERYLKERMIMERWNADALDDFFAHIIVYGIKDSYMAPKAAIRRWKKPNRTGRN